MTFNIYGQNNNEVFQLNKKIKRSDGLLRQGIKSKKKIKVRY